GVAVLAGRRGQRELRRARRRVVGVRIGVGCRLLRLRLRLLLLRWLLLRLLGWLSGERGDRQRAEEHDGNGQIAHAILLLCAREVGNDLVVVDPAAVPRGGERREAPNGLERLHDLRLERLPVRVRRRLREKSNRRERREIFLTRKEQYVLCALCDCCPLTITSLRRSPSRRPN